MKTVFEYTQSNVLVIPQALFSMKDVTTILQHHDSIIFYKKLAGDLKGVEFYTNTPCFIYIEKGREVITNSENQQIELCAGSGIFLSQGLTLNSDFVMETDELEAYLVFFDRSVITEFLSKVKGVSTNFNEIDNFLQVCDCSDISQFFSSIYNDINDPAYLQIKLLELLHLIAYKDKSSLFYSLLSALNTLTPKLNLKRLLDLHDVYHLTVSDLAHISGRSLSSFNRDFKAIYKKPPKQWLQEKRLSYAKVLLETTELTVTEVALEIGFENVSNFIKVFKYKYGQTPKKIKCKE